MALEDENTFLHSMQVLKKKARNHIYTRNKWVTANEEQSKAVEFIKCGSKAGCFA
jgi:hypothetical protein